MDPATVAKAAKKAKDAKDAKRAKDAKGASGIRNAGAKDAQSNGRLGLAKEAETNPRSLYSGSRGLYAGDKKEGDEDEETAEEERNLFRSKKKNGKERSTLSKVMAIGGILAALVAGLVVVVVGLPLIMIGAIDYNLQRMLGFDETVAILEKQAEYVTSEFLSKGKVPSEYADDLAEHGIEVGQVTLAGEFVRTNVYDEGLNSEIASINGIVATGDGELAIRFNDEIIKAEDFVARVESEPVLYAAYSAAADISTRFYYSEQVDAVYTEMGLSRGAFNSWWSEGHYEEEEEEFYNILYKVLDVNTIATSSGYDEGTKCEEELQDIEDEEGNVLVEAEDRGEKLGECYTIENVPQTDIGATIDEIAEKTVDVDEPSEKKATKKAAELLNMTLSAGEPYNAASTFMAIQEPIQRARIGDEGPVNHVMNMLMQPTAVSYKDINTGEMVEVSDVSLLDTQNFLAAVANEEFSPEEAENFSRDRILTATIDVDKEIINETMVATTGKKSSNVLIKFASILERWFAGILEKLFGGQSADAGILHQAQPDLELAYKVKNSDVLQSPIGGNRTVEGGAFISNTINTRTAGGLPSDQTGLFAYRNVAEEVFARQAEAERATLSPFDISSPNTFLGSIVHKLANFALVNSGSRSKNSILSLVSTVAQTVGSAAKDIFGGNSVVAEDGEGGSVTDRTIYTTLPGRNCDTVNSVANVVGDLYCTAHTAIETEYMEDVNSREAWIATINEFFDEEHPQFDEEGKIVPGSELHFYTILGMDRAATSGVESVDVCKRYNEIKAELEGEGETESTGFLGMLFSGLKKIVKSLFSSIQEFLTGWEFHDECEGLDDRATGLMYTLSGANGAAAEGLKEDVEWKDVIRYFSAFALYDAVESLLGGSESAIMAAKTDYYAKHPVDNSRSGVIARITGMSKEDAQFLVAYMRYLDTVIAGL